MTRYLDVQRRYGKQVVRSAAGHNTREDYAVTGVTSNIDPARMPLNLVLRGPDTCLAIARLGRSLMVAARVGTLRKDAVTMLEVLFTLPADSTIDPRGYFEACTRWAEQHFDVPVLSSIVHLDEGAPHCHLLLLPLRDGCMVGSRLYGSWAKLTARQAEFHLTVAQPYGLERQSHPHHSATVRNEAIALAQAALAASGMPADLAAFLTTPHRKNPQPLLEKLGLTMPAATRTSAFVALMTRPQKQSKADLGIGFHSTTA